jgi:lipopolysaccharide/colanic/teichoic acid biosynthesis glycosyltransferase
MQRTFDIIFSCLGLIALSPLFILVSCFLRVTGEGEVFYIQARIGKYGETFGLLKFATMLKNSPNIGSGEITINNDPRILPLGKFLRKSKINELPQLCNVLLGSMSLVGPRPMVPNTFANYSIIAQKTLNTVRPGLSGLGSIIFRNEEKLLDGKIDATTFYNNFITPYKSQLEIWFVENNSIGLYFKIIFATVLVVLFPKSNIVVKMFPNIPKLPKELMKLK